MDHASVIVRNFYSALASGMVQEALALLDADVQWTEARNSPYYAGTVVGPEAVVATVLAPIGKDFTAFQAVPSDFLTEGNRVAVFGSYLGISATGGRRLDAPFVHLWTVTDSHLGSFVQHTDSAIWNQALALTS